MPYLPVWKYPFVQRVAACFPHLWGKKVWNLEHVPGKNSWLLLPQGDGRLAPCHALGPLFPFAEWVTCSKRRRVRGLEEEAAQQGGHRVGCRTTTCVPSWATEQPGVLLEAPAVLSVAGVLREAGLGMHGSLFHLLWSVQLARRSCHFFPGRVEPVLLVQRAPRWRSRGLWWQGLW